MLFSKKKTEVLVPSYKTEVLVSLYKTTDIWFVFL